jgi:hypothetical protein
MAMVRYAGKGAAATGTDKTILALVSAATIRPALYDLVIGSGSTPADAAVKFHLERFTAVGTEGSGFTPLALDPDDAAARADYGVGVYAAEPTYTAGGILLAISVNQRATFRWVAAPGSEFKAPATANNGIGLQSQAVSTGTPTYEATMLHEE